MLKKINSYFAGLVYKIRARKFRKILEKHDTFTLKGYVFKIIELGDYFYVRCVQIRTCREVAIEMKHIRVKHKGKMIGLSDIGLFF